LPEEEIERVAVCSVDCQRCQEELSTLDSAVDTLIARLRKAAGSSADDVPGHVDLLICQAERLGPALTGDAASPPQAEETDPPDVPARLGQYRILERLGSGGMGMVYRAQHVMLHKPVALKVLLSLRADDRESIDRFIREMQAVGQVEHPNLVRATDAGEDAGRHFLVMELVEGIDVAALLARCGPLSVANACEIIRQAANGLAHVHAMGIIHRDVKPSNLMISYVGQVKVQDLGLAKVLAEQASGALTGSEQILGTLDYIAPEQVVPGGPIDGRTDVYGLGCTLYALLTGTPPFGGPEFDGPVRKIAAHVQRDAPSLFERRANAPAALAAAVARMLSKSPAGRFATASEVADAMAPFTEGSDLAALVRSATGGGSTVDLVRKSYAKPAATTTESLAHQARFRRVVASALVATLLVAGIVGTVLRSLIRNAAQPPRNVSGVELVDFEAAGALLGEGALLTNEIPGLTFTNTIISAPGGANTATQGDENHAEAPFDRGFYITDILGPGGFQLNATKDIMIEFAQPVTDLSLVLGDIDSTERFDFTVFDAEDAVLETVTVLAGDPGTGRQIATPVNFNAKGISRLVLDALRVDPAEQSAGFMIDNLQFAIVSEPPRQTHGDARAHDDDAASGSTRRVQPIFESHFKDRIIKDDDDMRRFEQDGRRYISVKPGNKGKWAYNSRRYDECIVEVVGRVTKGSEGGILVNFGTRKLRTGVKTGLCVILGYDRRVWVEPSLFADDEFKRIAPRFDFKHDAVKAAGSWNRLQFVVRNRSLDILVNGTRVCEPIECETDLTPFILAIGIAGIDNRHGASIELASIKVWDTTDIRRIAGQGELPDDDDP
jgi:serine/threonine protein kinase